MKKLFALALVVLGLAACQTEPEFDVNMGDGTTTISVVLPEDAITRATAADETNSAWDGLQNVKGETLRVIFQVYDENGVTKEGLRQTATLNEGEYVANFDVRLVPNRKYTFVAWADQGEEYFDVTDLKDVKILKWEAMDECRDAYTATHTEANFTSASDITLKLTRPFAKLRVITTDMKELGYLSIVPAEAEVEYSVALPNAFNAYAGETCATTAAKSFTNFDIAEYNQDAANTMTLFTDYILVPANGVVKFGLAVKEEGGRLIKNNDFVTDIPVKRNNLTTILGNVLTEANNIEVKVTPAFEDESVLPYELLQVLENGGEYKFENDMTIFKTLFINDDTNVVLDLNGKNITLATENEDLEYGDGIIVYGNLTIKGEGTITSKTRTIWARGNYGAEVNILGGHFIGANGATCEVIYASGDGKINIYGGKFEAVTMDDKSFAAPQYAILNLHGNGKTGCDIKVYGGSFKNFNPCDNVSENPKHNFCAPGFAAVADGEWFNVVSIAIDNVADFKTALANGQETIVLEGGVEFEGVFEINKPVEIISYATEKPIIKGRVIITEDCRIENVKFAINDTTKQPLGKNQNGNYAPFNGGANYQYKAIVYPFCASTTFVGCEFESDINSSVGAINFGDAHAENKLTVENSKFTGNFYPIRSRINFSVKNCEFNSSYNGDGLAAVFCFGMADEVGTIVFTDNTATTPNNNIFLGAYFYAKNHAYNAYITTSNNQGFYENGFSYAEGRVTMGDVYLNGNKL